MTRYMIIILQQNEEGYYDPVVWDDEFTSILEAEEERERLLKSAENLHADNVSIIQYRV